MNTEDRYDSIEDNQDMPSDYSISVLQKTKIYQYFKKLTDKNSEDLGYFQQVISVCKKAINVVNLIVNMYSNYTRHDIVHICNVLRLMADILGEDIDYLSADEAALLLMAACWHDTGMVVSNKQKKHLLSEDDEDIWDRYFRNHDEDRRKYTEGEADKETLLPNLIRAIHHERVKDQLIEIGLWHEWPFSIDMHIAKEELYMVCKSHGESLHVVNDFTPRSSKVDIRMCSILLRIADILDFDYSRAPKEIFSYIGLDNPETKEERFSGQEWKKHMGSYGFTFQDMEDMKNSLIFSANCKDPTTHHKVNEYIDWVEQELNVCKEENEKYNGRWNKSLILPDKVERRISASGFEAEDFCFNVGKTQIMELLGSKNLYNYDGIFIRELIQNALDAVRVRRKLENNTSDWMPEINIYSWTKDGSTWIAVDDNGIGMSKDIVKKYFLRVGCSYYESNEFKALFAKKDFKPTSRFGIGVLSCFVTDDSSSRIEVSTKYYKDLDGNETLRLSIPKPQGYYYLSTEAHNRNPDSEIVNSATMFQLDSLKSSEYRKEVGTTIAVRFSISKVQTYCEMTIKDILDRFVAFPDIPIHYKDLDTGEELDYMTEEKFAEIVNIVKPYDKDGFSKPFKYTLPNERFQELKDYYPEAKWDKAPTLETEFFHLGEVEPFKSEPCMDGLLMMSNTSCSEPVVCTVNSKSFYAYLNFRFFEHGVELFASAYYPYTVRGMLVHTENILVSAGSRFAEGSYEKGIYDAIIDGSYYMKKWRREFASQNDILENEIDTIIKEALRPYVDPDKLSEYLIYRKFEYKYCWKYKFVPEIPAYEKDLGRIFSEHYIPDHLVRKASYNGIYTGAICNYSYPAFGWEVIASTIILKDRYRPDLTINRFEVIRIPLEVVCMFNVLKMYLQHVGKEVFIYPYIGDQFGAALIEYRKLFKSNPSIMEYLYIDTYEGTLRWHEIKKRLEDGNTVILNISWESYQLLRLSIAVLLEHFEVRLRIDQPNHASIAVFLKKDITILPKQIESFAPGLFLYTMEPKSMYLSSGTKYDFPVYNIEHPFAEWLISNKEKIEKNATDIFKAICNWLCIGGDLDDIDERRIDNINKQLLLLKEHKHMHVPRNVILKKSDFLSLDVVK